MLMTSSFCAAAEALISPLVPGASLPLPQWLCSGLGGRFALTLCILKTPFLPPDLHFMNTKEGKWNYPCIFSSFLIVKGTRKNFHLRFLVWRTSLSRPTKNLNPDYFLTVFQPPTISQKEPKVSLKYVYFS